MKVLMLASEDELCYRVLRGAAGAGCTVDVLGVAGRGGSHRLAWSRFCRHHDAMPPEATDDELLARVTSIVRERGIAMVVPSDIPTTRWLTRYAARLPCRAFPVPAAATFDALDDKASFAEICRAAGVPHPPTRTLESGAALLAALKCGDVRLPLILKPTAAQGSQGVQPLAGSDPIDLLRAIDYTPVLVQDFVPGQDLCVSVYCQGGKILASVVYRYLGSEGYFEIVQDEQAHGLVARVIDHTRFDGVAGFDLRVHPQGRAWMIECNPRFTYNLDISILAGVNFVELGLGRRDAAAPELRAEPRRILHARPFKPWTMTQEHGRYLLDDDPRLWLYVHARIIAGRYGRRARSLWRRQGAALSTIVAPMQPGG